MYGGTLDQRTVPSATIPASAIVDAVLGRLSPEHILACVGRLIFDLIPHDFTRIAAAPPDEGTARVLMASHKGRPVQLPEEAIRLDGSRADEAVSRGRTLVLDAAEVAAIRALGTWPGGAGVRSLMYVPLAARTTLRGCIELGSSEPGRFGPREIEIADRSRERISDLIEHAWLLRESRALARLEERHRVMGEVQSALGGRLGDIVLELQLTESKLRVEPATAQAGIRRSWALARECLEAGQALMFGRDPSAPESFTRSEVGDEPWLAAAAPQRSSKARGAVFSEDGVTDQLTVREYEVLGLIARGQRNREIAEALGLTEATAKYHVAHLLIKLGVDNRTRALVKAQELGLLPANAS